MSKALLVAFAFVFATISALSPADARFHLEPERRLEVDPPGMFRIGKDEPANIHVDAGLSRQDTISYAGARYIAVMFTAFSLPPGDEVIVRSPDNRTAYSYTEKGRSNAGSFHASLIPGDMAIVEYIARNSTALPTDGGYGYSIPSFARGFQRSQIQTICGADQSAPAKCFAPGAAINAALPLAYQRAQAVARLVINGSYGCTAWLAGSEGHLLTNYHCISTSAYAENVDVEFEAESGSCDEQCTSWLGCMGKVVATTTAFITNSATRDYALLKLPASADVNKYGYLQLRATGPVLNEPIYIPQHPQSYAKRIASTIDGGMPATITALNVPACVDEQVAYEADTQGGSSGSPVLSQVDNQVIAIHNCGGGGCGNFGVDVKYIIADLTIKGIPVKDLVATAMTPTLTPVPTAFTPLPGSCMGLSFAMCQSLSYCVWNPATRRCQR